jgi:hypothetical protein
VAGIDSPVTDWLGAGFGFLGIIVFLSIKGGTAHESLQ